MICIDAIGNINFVTVKQPVIALVFGAGFYTYQVTAGVRLSHANDKNAVSTNTLRQEPLSLLIASKMFQIGCYQTAMKRVVKSGLSEITIFLYHYLLIAKILLIESAVTLIGTGQEKVLRAHFLEHLAWNYAGFLPSFSIRAYLLRNKFTVGIMKDNLISVKQFRSMFYLSKK
jgi:hypothetical protein